MLRSLCAAFFLLALSGHASIHAQSAEVIDKAKISDKEQFCKQLKQQQIPQADRPSSADVTRLKGCDSANLYYGVGVPRNPIDARKCAVQEDASSPLGGPILLMQIYANGQGVRRNFDIAMYMACQTHSSRFELASLLDHLVKMRGEYESGQCGVDGKPDCTPLKFCEHASSGSGTSACAELFSDLDVQNKDTADSAVIAQWPWAQRAAFFHLRQAANAYISAHASGEVDLSGSMRGIFITDHKAFYSLQFRSNIEGAEKANWPGKQLSLSDIDRELNEIYRKVLATQKHDMFTVSPDDVRTTQRLWLRFRDEFVSFMRLRHPNVPSDDVKAALTRERISTLKVIPSVDPEGD